MPTYKITIEETVTKTVSIEAESEKEALKLIEDSYKSGETVLEPGELTAVEFYVN
ncbi:MAG: DpnD/PcfM family protein [Clostridia bacterium]|nr:DpnD/PcfM family protein [Clostridia bacterium]